MGLQKGKSVGLLKVEDVGALAASLQFKDIVSVVGMNLLSGRRSFIDSP